MLQVNLLSLQKTLFVFAGKYGIFPFSIELFYSIDSKRVGSGLITFQTTEVLDTENLTVH